MFCREQTGRRPKSVFLANPLLDSRFDFGEKLGELSVGLERTEEIVLRLLLVGKAADMVFDFLVANDDVVFVGEAFELNHNAGGRRSVDDEDAEEQPDEERECEVSGQPPESREDMRMDEEVVHRPEECPGEREFRADNSTIIEPLVTVIPKSDVRHLEAEHACGILNGCKRHAHHDEQQNFAECRIFRKNAVLGRGDEIENAQSEAVQRKIRAGAKAWVNPTAFGIIFGEKSSEEQLDDPTADRADKEQKRKYQKQIHLLRPFVFSQYNAFGTEFQGDFMNKDLDLATSRGQKQKKHLRGSAFA